MSLSLHIGLSITGSGGGGSASLPMAALGSQIVFYGDGVMSEGAAPGFRNGPGWTLAYLNGRALPAPAWMQCASGGSMDTIYARRAYTVLQQADIPVFTSQGHNDGLLNTDPDSDSTQFDKWTRNLDQHVADHPNASIIPVMGTIPSNVSGESTASTFDSGISRRQRVWNLQAAYVTALADSRVFFVDVSDYDFTNWNETTDASRVHPNAEGGWHIGNTYLGPAISARMASATKDEILELWRLGTYPGTTGSNLYGDPTLSGTGGTKSGTVAPTGEYADGQRITNNLTNGTSVSVVCSKAGTGPYQQIVTISGTPASENTITQNDTANLNLSAAGITKGMHVAQALGFQVDNGTDDTAQDDLVNLGMDTGAFGTLFSTGSLGVHGAFNHAVNAAFIVPPKAVFGATPTANPVFTTRWAANALGARTVMDRPALYKLSTPSQSAAGYVGGDGLLTSNYRLRTTGSISATTFGTVTIEPGGWCPYGVSFTAVRLYRNGTAGGADGQSGHGTGTLIATLSAGTWTYATSGGDGLVSTDKIHAEVDAISSIGSTYTARTDTANAITVSA